MRSLTDSCARLKTMTSARAAAWRDVRPPVSWMRRTLLASSAGLALLLGTPAFAVSVASFGSTATTGTPSNGLTGDFKRASRFTLTQQGMLEYIEAYLDGQGGGGGTQNIRFVVYRDAGGVPDAKVAETPVVAQVWAGAPAGWFQGYFPTYVVLDPGAYWLAIQSDSNASGVARDYSTGTEQNWYGNADAYADGASDPFGAGTVGTGTLLIRGQYHPTAGLSHFGRTDIATVPSNGLSADYKRASRFSLAEKGTLVGLSAYLDAAGGASGSQLVRLVLYRDEGGVPGAEVVASNYAQIPARSLQGWIFLLTTPAALDPGSYWIAIQTGGTAGVLRDYGDGAPNWYGNSDAYNDGPSNPFGAGTAGSSTLSAYAFYQPGYTIEQFGNTSVGSTPSTGLTANYIRGSTYSAVSAYGGITGFYAYLDGNGGASGSQALRIASYHDDRGSPASKVGESQTVSIAAGMTPQWVYFPVPVPIPLSSLDWFAIHSGDVGGVARDYGSSGGAWSGAPAPFANGAPSPWPTSSVTGNTTLSIYATYVVAASWWTSN